MKEPIRKLDGNGDPNSVRPVRLVVAALILRKVAGGVEVLQERSSIAVPLEGVDDPATLRVATEQVYEGPRTDPVGFGRRPSAGNGAGCRSACGAS